MLVDWWDYHQLSGGVWEPLAWTLADRLVIMRDEANGGFERGRYLSFEQDGILVCVVM